MIKRLLILVLLLIAVPCWGANVYIDPTYGSGGDGSFATPYDSWTDVDLSVANDYRQLCGTTETLATGLTITAVGSSGDHVIIGAYYDSSGTPVHEDDNPSFGANCGNDVSKPILQGTSGTPSDYELWAMDDFLMFGDEAVLSQYLEFNSLRFQKQQVGLFIRSNYNTVKYCYFWYLTWGMRIGNSTDGDNNTIEYNYFDLNDQTDEGSSCGGVQCGYDPISLREYAQNNLVRYNHMTGHDHAGVAIAGGDNNTIEYNYFYGTNYHEDIGVAIDRFSSSGRYNIVRYNYMFNTGEAMQITGARYNEVYGNVMVCLQGMLSDDGMGCITFGTGSSSLAAPPIGNLVYNNVIYGTTSGKTKQHGIYFYGIDDAGADLVKDNVFANNIINNIGGACISQYDPVGAIDDDENYFYNNSCYDWNNDTGYSYAYIGDTGYTKTQLNDLGFASGNIDTDPSLEDVSTYKFWPASTSSPVYQTGYNVGDPYDTLLLSTSDFTAEPPEVNKDQFGTDYIGAYGLVGESIPSTPLQGAAGNFKYN